MKILEYSTSKSGLLRILTDNPGRDTFVYPKNRFSNVEDLKIEILRSIDKSKARSDQAMEKNSALVESMDVEING